MPNRFILISVLLHCLVLFGVAGPSLNTLGPNQEPARMNLILNMSQTSPQLVSSLTENPDSTALNKPSSSPVEIPKPRINASTLLSSPLVKNSAKSSNQDLAKNKTAPQVQTSRPQTAQQTEPQVPLDHVPNQSQNHEKTDLQNGPVGDFLSVGDTNPSPVVQSLNVAPALQSVRSKQFTLGTNPSSLVKIPVSYRFYLDAWQSKVENIGQRLFPDRAARETSNPVLTLSLLIRADGSLGFVHVVQSSGNPELDQAAIRIVEAGAPYAKFPPNISAELDQMEIVRTWRFVG